MAKDLLRYDALTQNAMRGVVREVLRGAEKDGLPGDHHFFITFVTNNPGVEISDALIGRYPTEMTIVLQHQYWGLEVDDDKFCVSLTFNKVPERLVIPFSAIRGFYDPSVQFGLQFPVETEGASAAVGLPITDIDNPALDPESSESDDDETDQPEEDKTGDIVSLDAFRKK